MKTTWTEFYAPDASSDRGWLKAITAPLDRDRWMEYTHETMPVFDEDINGWREQSTLGNYLDYGPEHFKSSTTPGDGFIHAVCYASKTSHYFPTVAEAKSWIETEALRMRPELEIQTPLFA